MMGKIMYPVKEKINIHDNFGKQKKWFKTAQGSSIKGITKWYA